MKKPLTLINYVLSLSLVFASTRAESFIGIQRTVNSSRESFNNYLKKTERSSFSKAYLQLSQKMEVSSKYIESCLENLYLGKNDAETCLSALKEITQRPLNPTGREILFSFLTKTEKINGSNRQFFKNLKLGLLETDPELSHIKPTANKSTPKAFASLEIKAWKKALGKVLSPEDFQLLVNGREVKNFKNWIPPSGVYQWSLITNTHEPLIRLGTFLEFASESLKDLKPFAENCKALTNIEIKKFGLLQAEIFASEKCIAKEDVFQSQNSPHLAQVPTSAPINLTKPSWLWPTLIVIGAGVALGLKGKQVQVNWPSFK